jgi:nucleoside-diphosphate-sugar epimerase
MSRHRVIPPIATRGREEPPALTAERVVACDVADICRRLQTEFSLLSGRRLFISGGAGFLGFYLIQSLLHWNRSHPGAEPVHVTVCDNYIRGVPSWLARLSRDSTVILLQHDITQPLPGSIGPFDYLIHAASIASPTYYRKHPIQTMDANVNGLRLLLDRCVAQHAQHKVSGLLFFSTSEIYGDPPPDQIPTPETCRGSVSCTGPRACYDESKRFGETLCVNFARQFGLPITVVRPFNNYGPGLKISDRRVIPDFARDLFAGRDLTLLSDGTPTRTFCYVADAVVGYYKVLLRGRSGEAYNIGSDSPEISMLDLAELVARIARENLGYTGSVARGASQEKDYLTDNPQRRCPVIAKAMTELGFHPEVSLEEGIRRTLIWYRDNQHVQEA